MDFWLKQHCRPLQRFSVFPPSLFGRKFCLIQFKSVAWEALHELLLNYYTKCGSTISFGGLPVGVPSGASGYSKILPS